MLDHADEHVALARVERVVEYEGPHPQAAQALAGDGHRLDALDQGERRKVGRHAVCGVVVRHE
ncbi:hypothetical protein [Embleya sp. NPDC020630]|uniref:hypothetical protein n=1 Tax=Embleya sp. NPDC020630 TaxID=3363979 RepID=UPI0037AD827B